MTLKGKITVNVLTNFIETMDQRLDNNRLKTMKVNQLLNQDKQKTPESKYD